MEEKKSNPDAVGICALGFAALGFFISKEQGGNIGNVMLLSGIGGAVGSLIGFISRQLYLFFKKKTILRNDILKQKEEYIEKTGKEIEKETIESKKDLVEEFLVGSEEKSTEDEKNSCPSCGTILAENSKVCIGCGKVINW